MVRYHGGDSRFPKFQYYNNLPAQTRLRSFDLPLAASKASLRPAVFRLKSIFESATRRETLIFEIS